MHARKIIHRDLKAENILMSGPSGSIVKIGDFGIAKILGYFICNIQNNIYFLNNIKTIF